MAPEKLPLELEEEILSRTQAVSLSRFKTVCKRWNSLINDKSFLVNNFHLASRRRPEFMMQTGSKIYSLSVNLENDPKVMERELNLDNVSGFESHSHEFLGECNGYLLCSTDKGGVLVWNPLLKQTRLIEAANMSLLCGLGYDNRKPEKSYKVFGRTALYELGSWKYADDTLYRGSSHNIISFNGNLYWTAYNNKTRECSIQCFDCSMEIFKHFCIMPCTKNHFSWGIHILSVFKGDRFSLLEQCNGRGKIKVWVTKNKVDDVWGGEVAVWMSFIKVSIPNVRVLGYYPTYFIEETHVKSLVICYTEDYSSQASIYIVKGHVSKHIRLGYKVCEFGQCITYVPSLIPIPF